MISNEMKKLSCKRVLIFSLTAAIAGMAVMAFSLLGCDAGGDDDDNSPAPSDDDAASDDTSGGDDDDDAIDDDTTGDDSTDDDTAPVPHPPILSNPRCDLNVDPALFLFDICDEGDDLRGGYLYWYDNYDYQAAFDQFESEGFPISPADDCSQPLTLGLALNPVAIDNGFTFPAFFAMDAAGDQSGPWFEGFVCA